MMFKRLMLISILLFCPLPAMAAAVKIHVAEFKVTGTAGKDDLKQALQGMLASRLSSENIRLAGAEDAPELTVVGTYIVFGKVFSLDAGIVAANGKQLGRAFEQGESADDVIPAVGRLADKLRVEFARVAAAGMVAPGVSAPLLPKIEPPATAPLAVVVSPGIIRPSQAEKTKTEGDIIRSEGLTSAAEGGLVGQRLDGAMAGIARLKRAGNGQRELVVALKRELRLYGQDKGLQLLATEKSFKGNEKILAVDVADLDGDGVEELYVTIFKGDELASRVYQFEKGRFKQIAANLPYFFRGMTATDGVNRIYAQQVGITEDFYGDMYQLMKNGLSFEVTKPMRLPRFGTVYNVNLFKGKDGKLLFIALHPDGYLAVYDEKGENLWKGSEKFGGSEGFFTRDDPQNSRITGSQERKVFLEQRIIVTKENIVIVPKNEGTFVIGDSRSFNKNSLYAFAWTGAAMEELWHTKPSQNYLADYLYDADNKEMLIVEVVKKEGVTDKGASAISIKKVD